MKYLALLYQHPKNYSLYFPDVQGCGATGASVDEALKNAVKALELHFEDEEKFPESRSLAWHLEHGLETEDAALLAFIPYEPALVA